ncbi:ribosome small subunit-dependent GTPase A [Dictyobacter arantiisoli]|uniref:Small ribosomal subunit biogenesis GTPase RsgA n=1 Tax=Dictyobacter arantiisoli TaxID=2014874 RepID=A0A5A5TD79_9CHLR|nr:ribosome small subunit-dependent GTPase A [Dictyobacter arantiisoli]GCF09228.1 putative ribosome biogenesis GTPase RsgA [Dictyobacter arantiisoli]
MINNPAQLTGMVLNGAHGIYDVHTDNGIMRCTLRGKLKKAFAQANTAKAIGKVRQTQQQRANKYSTSNEVERTERIEKHDSSETPAPVRLSVGDYVVIRKLDETTGLIEEILPRKSELSRLDAGSNANKLVQQTLLANLNQVVVVFATAQPDPHFGLLDRYLTICESAQLMPVICINKADLPHEDYVEEAIELYSQLGYTVIRSSTHTEEGIAQLREILKDHTTLFTGPSGVGKSSLVNAIEPGMALRTGLVSDVTGKGRHTTTGSQLYPLSKGGWLADSAGIRALATWNIAPEELAWCFREFRPYLGECFYSDCAHLDEEGCAICQAVDDGLINERRHRSYVRMYTGVER